MVWLKDVHLKLQRAAPPCVHTSGWHGTWIYFHVVLSKHFPKWPQADPRLKMGPWESPELAFQILSHPSCKSDLLNSPPVEPSIKVTVKKAGELGQSHLPFTPRGISKATSHRAWECKPESVASPETGSLVRTPCLVVCCVISMCLESWSSAVIVWLLEKKYDDVKRLSIF